MLLYFIQRENKETINFRDNLFEIVMANERRNKDRRNNVHLQRFVLDQSCRLMMNEYRKNIYFVVRRWLLFVH